MKKICFVIPRTYYLFYPETSGTKVIPGGAQMQVYYLSTATAEDENFEVHFLLADLGQPDFEIQQHVKLHKSYKFSDHLFKRIRKLFKTLKNINADTYIFRSADAGVALAFFYVKKILRKKVLYMLASDVETSKLKQKKYSGFLTAFMMQYVYNQADIISSQTVQQAKLFEKNRNRKPDIVLKNIFPERESSDIKFEEKQTILWVGRLTKVKNPELFLNLAEKYPVNKFVMIAPLSVKNKNYGKKILEQAKQIKNIQIINFVSPSDIFAFYKNAKIYVSTSELEGFSNTMAEAMQAECALLSYNVNPDNILNKYEFGFCAEKNIDKFYAYFENLLENSELRKELGKNGKNHIAEYHQEKEIINVFKNLMLN